MNDVCRHSGSGRIVGCPPVDWSRLQHDRTCCGEHSGLEPLEQEKAATLAGSDHWEIHSDSKTVARSESNWLPYAVES